MGGIYKSRAVRTNHLITNGVVEYIELPAGYAPYLALQLDWDSSAAFTVTLETTNKPHDVASESSTDARHWSAESGVSLTGAAGGSAGSSMKHLSSVCARRTRLKITPTATGRIEVWAHGKA